MKTAAIIACALLATAPPLHAQTEGDYLYDVTLLRAAPGAFTDLIEVIEEARALHREAGDEAPFWMRHSQGDHWDFMLIRPMGTREAYHAPERTRRRTQVWSSTAGVEVQRRLEAATSYEENWFARSVPLDEMQRRFEGMGFLHIEMFAGLPGKRAELIEQRRMENRFYAELDRQLNLVFTRESGSSWDAMTIGFYEDLQAYAAAGGRHSAAEQEAAARAAGFDGVGAIAPYLRSLLSRHNDTLATAVARTAPDP